MAPTPAILPENLMSPGGYVHGLLYESTRTIPFTFTTGEGKWATHPVRFA